MLVMSLFLFEKVAPVRSALLCKKHSRFMKAWCLSQRESALSMSEPAEERGGEKSLRFGSGGIVDQVSASSENALYSVGKQEMPGLTWSVFVLLPVCVLE